MKKLLYWIPVLGVHYTIKYAVDLNRFETAVLPSYHGAIIGCGSVLGMIYLYNLAINL